jgi:hypothetical protein
MKIDVVK